MLVIDITVINPMRTSTDIQFTIIITRLIC